MTREYPFLPEESFSTFEDSQWLILEHVSANIASPICAGDHFMSSVIHSVRIFVSLGLLHARLVPSTSCFQRLHRLQPFHVSEQFFNLPARGANARDSLDGSLSIHVEACSSSQKRYKAFMNDCQK